MRFIHTPLQGAFAIELEKHVDRRGFFARTYCAREFEGHRLDAGFVQCSISFNARRGTLRGLHYQVPPHSEAKLVRCTHGSVYEVIVDLRPESSTCGQYFALELSAASGRSLYVPEGFAHGFQTLEDNTEVFYQITNYFAPESASGLRYDDPDLGIPWPLPVSVISDKDLRWPLMAHWKNPFKDRNPDSGVIPGLPFWRSEVDRKHPE